MGRYPLKAFMASRGCPYDCTYCFNRAWRRMYEGRGQAVRRHSVDYVIEAIRNIQERWPLSNVKFQDDVFTFRADAWLEEFSRRFPREVGVPFYVNTRCDLLTEDMAKLLKAAGCRTISMSIEAGNPRIREQLCKRRMSDERIVAAHRLCERYGIHTYTNCMLGLPRATTAEDLESLDLCLKSRVTWAEFPIFHPYPQTELGDQTIRQGMYAPDYGKMHTSNLSGSPLACFTDREKDIQRNLTALAPVAIVWPWLRGLIVKRLIYLPPNRLFTLVYWLAKNYVVRRKLYVTKTDWRESLRIYMASLRQELFRRKLDEDMR
jgi:pyruvate-formate lyase-activating enzyme